MVQNNNTSVISASTVGSYLKLTQKSWSARNSINTKEQRVQYGEYLLEYENLTYIFIEEVGYSNSVQRNRDRAPKGENAILDYNLQQTYTFTTKGIYQRNIYYSKILVKYDLLPDFSPIWDFKILPIFNNELINY